MKYLLLAVFLSFTSCGTIQRVFQKTSNHQISKSDSTVKSHKDSSGQVKTVIKERIDTQITTKPDTAQSSIPLKTLLNTDTVTSDDGQVRTQISYSPVTQKISVKTVVKPQKVTVRKDKTTETVSNSKVVTDIKSEVKKQDKVRDKSSTETVKKSGFQIPWWIWLLAVLLLLAGAYWIYRKVKL